MIKYVSQFLIIWKLIFKYIFISILLFFCFIRKGSNCFTLTYNSYNSFHKIYLFLEVQMKMGTVLIKPFVNTTYKTAEMSACFK